MFWSERSEALNYMDIEVMNLSFWMDGVLDVLSRKGKCIGKA